MRSLFHTVERLNGDDPTVIHTQHGIADDVESAVQDAISGTNSITIASASGANFTLTIQTEDGLQSGHKFIRMFGFDPDDNLYAGPSPFDRLTVKVEDCTEPYSRWQVLRGERSVLAGETNEEIRAARRRRHDRLVNTAYGVGGTIFGAAGSELVRAFFARQ